MDCIIFNKRKCWRIHYETNNFVKYSEEELNNMTKEQLQGILDELGVSYRKNNTNATLINLILGYYNSEE